MASLLEAGDDVDLERHHGLQNDRAHEPFLTFNMLLLLQCTLTDLAFPIMISGSILPTAEPAATAKAQRHPTTAASQNLQKGSTPPPAVDPNFVVTLSQLN